MNTKHNFSISTLLVSMVLVSLIAVACSAPAPAPTPIVAQPTKAPALSTPVASPQPKPTKIPATQSQPIVSPQPKPTEAPTIAPTAQSTAKIMPFGQAQLMSQLSIAPSRYEFLAESGSDKPKTGDQYLIVTFLIENTSKTSDLTFNPADMVVLSPTGTVLSMVTLKSLKDELTTQTLKPGAKLSGVIAYEVPATEAKWTLELKGANNQNLMWSNAG